VQFGNTPANAASRRGSVSDEQQPVRIVLTTEQREMVRRLSGQHVEAIDLEPDDDAKTGGELKFRWRLSDATGIPRQAWMRDSSGTDKQG
jgi:hypothetical protein